ncbi:MAG: acetyl-CoA carboxylase biotin carboxylase subunit family protein [Bacteriovoracaceae bacterium]
MKKIVVVAPNPWSYQEIMKRSDQYDFVFYEGEFQKEKLSLLSKLRLLKGINFEKEVEGLVRFARKISADAIIGVDEFLSCLIVTKANERLGFPHNNLALELTLQHKYYSRILQKSIIPDHVPAFSLWKGIATMSCPYFIKPIRGSASLLASAINDESDLNRYKNIPITKKIFLKSLLRQFNLLCSNYGNLAIVDSPLIAEELITGIQLTVEGFVQNGENHIVGIVDSVMYPGSRLSFKQFDYPSKLPEHVQSKLSQITNQFIQGIGYKHGFYNVEYFYNPETNEIKLIEINPRMAFQFTDLYEKVDGINTFDVFLQLVTGEKATLKHREGIHKCATSFVKRTFEDGLVQEIPSKHEIDRVEKDFAARVLIQTSVGQWLSSDFFQDVQSFRLMTVNIGGESQTELDYKNQLIEDRLKFVIQTFKPQERSVLQRALGWT